MRTLKGVGRRRGAEHKRRENHILFHPRRPVCYSSFGQAFAWNCKMRLSCLPGPALLSGKIGSPSNGLAGVSPTNRCLGRCWRPCLGIGGNRALDPLGHACHGLLRGGRRNFGRWLRASPYLVQYSIYFLPRESRGSFFWPSPQRAGFGG